MVQSFGRPDAESWEERIARLCCLVHDDNGEAATLRGFSPRPRARCKYHLRSLDGCFHLLRVLPISCDDTIQGLDIVLLEILRCAVEVPNLQQDRGTLRGLENYLYNLIQST